MPPSRRVTGHKGQARGTGCKALGADFEKLRLSKRDSPMRHAAARHKTIRPGQIRNVSVRTLPN